MHFTFKLFSSQPNKVDSIIRNEPPKFSQVFHILFHPKGEHSESIQSYLELLEGFKLSNEMVEEQTSEQSVVKCLYDEFKIYWDAEDGVCQFWVYLVQMYRIIITGFEMHRPNFDNIFAFMNGFPVTKTRVVIIGQDPSPNCESTGYAFHGSFCESTIRLVENFENYDNKYFNFLCENGSRSFIQVYRDREILDGWIEQGVLLLNTYLTVNEYRWVEFTDFLVKELSSRNDCLVFILACRRADRFKQLIDKEKHVVFCVHHPNNPEQNDPSTRKYQWDTQLPYLNANYYFYQKSKEYMIDWVHVKKGKGSINLTKYKQGFEEITQDGEKSQILLREPIKTGQNVYFVLRKNVKHLDKQGS